MAPRWGERWHEAVARGGPQVPTRKAKPSSTPPQTWSCLSSSTYSPQPCCRQHPLTPHRATMHLSLTTLVRALAAQPAVSLDWSAMALSACLQPSTMQSLPCHVLLALGLRALRARSGSHTASFRPGERGWRLRRRMLPGHSGGVEACRRGQSRMGTARLAVVCVPDAWWLESLRA